MPKRCPWPKQWGLLTSKTLEGFTHTSEILRASGSDSKRGLSMLQYIWCWKYSSFIMSTRPAGTGLLLEGAEMG